MHGKFGGITADPNAVSTSDDGTFPKGNYDELVKIVLCDPDLNVKQKRQLIDELRKGNAYDRWTYRSAIWILGVIGFVSIIALWVLSSGPYENKVPEGIIAMGSAAIGGSAGLLATGRSKN